MQSKNIVLNSI